LHFGRPITLGCLFCHCNQAEYVAHTVNRYRQPIFQGYAIGCERCHGPGELHVKRRADGEVVDGLDDSIVNPARLDHSLREAVCQQCHLQGEQRVVARGRLEFDFRPGLPLHLFQMDFVKGGESRDDLKFVSSVEQMVASRCYRTSEDPKKLGCISCHDPHRLPAPEEKVAYFRKRCLNCHTEKACSLPLAQRLEKSKEDSCIACHMPRTGSEISHTSITDHRIPRHAERSAPGIASSRAPPGPSQLVPFHSDLVDLKDEEVSRNYGVALVAMLERKPPEAIARQFSYKALPLLERALKRDPHDLPAWDAKGTALWALGQQDEALAAYETALEECPEWESLLHAAANLALTMNRPDTARTYLERVIQINPWRWQYHHLLAGALFQNRDWEEAARACRQSLQLEPFNSTARRRLLVDCYLRLGWKVKAEAEFETLLQLSPENRRADLRRWFENQGPR
jgi:cytochrome c-type biogenesis protein CcmH/NrfG